MDVNSVIGLLETCTNKKQFDLLVLVIDEEIDAIRKQNFPKPKRVRKPTKLPWENNFYFSQQCRDAGQKLLSRLQKDFGDTPRKVFGDHSGKIELIRELRAYNGENNAFDPNRIDLKQARDFIEQYFAEWY